MRQTLSLVLAILLAVSPVGAAGTETAAMLHPTGRVLLNSNEAIGISAVFPGDRVQTVSDSVAAISTPDSTVSLLPETSVLFVGTRLQLTSGVVRVRTNGPWSMLCSAWTINSSGPAEFEASRSGGKLLISARAGGVDILGRNTSMHLKAGEATELQDPASGSGSEVRTPPSAGHVAIILGVAGAAAAAAMAGIVLQTSKQPLSPSQP